MIMASTVKIEIVIPKANGRGYETTGGILKVQAKSGANMSFPIRKKVSRSQSRK